MAAQAFISGCAGLRLTPEELAFFAEAEPWGLILFRRNCQDPAQIRDLAAAFRGAVGRADAPVLIDQEGGRVQRLRPPNWPQYPPARVLGLVEEAGGDGKRAAWLQGRLIAADLSDLGINVNCAPVLDVLVPETNPAIGNRSFGGDPARVAALGRAYADGMAAGGVLGTIKHMPGQGRATLDSHEALPGVDASLDTLTAGDFAPFAALADMPAAMTGHVVYTAIDPDNPATTSATVIRDIIRDRIKFDGLLLSDDISMKALSGDYSARAAAIRAAGCDLVLHCNGQIDEMRAVAAAVPALAGRSAERARRALASIRPPEPFDRAEGRAELLALAETVAWTPAGSA